MNKDTKEVTAIWKKHFGDNPSVPFSKTEAFFNELAEYERAQDSKKNFRQAVVSSSVCSECKKEMDEIEHNYGTEEILVCLQCYNDAQNENTAADDYLDYLSEQW